MRWLPTWLIGRILRVEVDEERCRFFAPLTRRPLLELTRSLDRSSPDRVLFYITGGLLLRKNHGRARLEFREALDRGHVIAAIHDYEPSLPWLIYLCSQARVHLAVMNAFGRHLRRIAKSAASR